MIVNLKGLPEKIQEVVTGRTPAYGLEPEPQVIAMTDIPSQDNQQEEEDLYKSDPIMDAPSPESEEEAEFKKMEQQGFFFVTHTTKELIRLVTLFWERIECPQECQEPEGHRHYVYDPETTAKEYSRTITLYTCARTECEEKPTIHSHRPDTNKVIEIEIPPTVLKKVWGIEAEGPEPSQINMVWMGTEGLVEYVDERGYNDMVSAPFQCYDRECPDYPTNHQHLFNIDPRYPHIPLPEKAINAMIRQGFLCGNSECEWEEMHIHFSKNE